MYLSGTFFSYLGVPRSNLGARKAKLDNIKSIEHRYLQFFVKQVILVALILDPKSALNLKVKILSREGMN